MVKYNKAVYPLLILVIGILVLYYINNVSEGFAAAINAVPLIDSSTIPNSQSIPIYLLMKSASEIKTVALKTPNNVINKVELNSNILSVTLNGAYSVQDFVVNGFNKDKWELGIVDGGEATMSLINTADNKILNRKSNKGLKKLPQTLTTFKIGPITPAAFGGILNVDVNGDPKNDKDIVSGPANIRIDLLLSK
jgi:hypothetical protein